MRLDFDQQELNQLADAVSEKVLERLKPLLAKTTGQRTNGLLTVDDLGRLLGVPKSKIYNLVHLKEIPYVKVGKALRFRRRDIDIWLESNHTPALNGISNNLRGGVKK